jgi:glycosyltransferase involved in cell wall biosynthesis
MKILHLISGTDPRTGGPIEGILRQSQADDGVTREIVCLDHEGSPWLAQLPLKTYALGHQPRKGVLGSSRLPWNRYRITLRLIPWLITNVDRYDAVVVNGLWNFTTAAFAIVTIYKRPRYVVFPHGMLDPWFAQKYPIKNLVKQIFWWFADGRVVNNAAYVLFTSDEERLLARRSFWPYRPRERVVAYGAADLPDRPSAQRKAFEQTVPMLHGRRYLLFLGRIHPKKGCDILIDAFASLAPAHPKVDLVIAGPDQVGLRADLEGRVRKAGISPRVHWAGMLEADAKWGALRDAEALVLPSHQENFGIVVAEALACSVPVLISDKVNIWREVKESGGGLVEPDTLEGTRDLLDVFLKLEPEQFAYMRIAARACYDTHFRAQEAAKDLSAIVAKLMRA